MVQVFMRNPFIVASFTNFYCCICLKKRHASLFRVRVVRESQGILEIQK